ncbi:pyruvate dehydrogenase complex dihydrolipoamide acetyltransferase, long form [Hoeflea sp. IMCC20628]|uniref:pyruvate dehydrogenase complex dihydrolipoamide acetyltransferase n=1 Tax=Hoeflea sp. IMCC20628 TaxID=1620421 RepID=UPI00063AAE22|nr:pyruvate dehydrogenase complex dihydrolipoamide acetyltransferase [Hoeflea sp. IMCC20628]AKI00793.1 pyruvate dehydrogenase complex dihydrolipoamide acetyltransferase, long form [Hoeflea sp. IMCC20628]
MPINITMPALSPTMEEGNLAKWMVKEGDKVSSGDVLCEIETDKATMEVESIDEGTVAKLVVAAGTEGVKVNDLIAILAAEGESVEDAAKGGGEAAAAPAAAPAEAPKAEAAKTESAPTPDNLPIRDVNPAAPAAPPAPVSASGERTFSSPLARRIAKDAGLDVSAISGSGPHGRVIKADVEAAMAAGTGKAAAAPQAAAAAAPVAAAKGMSDDAVLKNFAEGSYELVKHDGMRKTIARRLQESKQTIPHFYVTVDCELDALLALRAQLNKAAPIKDDKPVYKLSVNDMVIKALALALRDVPDANVSWTDENMVMHKHSDVGVAVSIPGGLITPIIRSAEQKTLSAISNEMKDLGKRAKDRKLKPEEYQGGTSSVSNMGMMGVKDFAAVINPPHATILAVGAGEQRPVVKDGALAIATVMSVTLSTDHRAVDGALGAQLLAAFKGYIQSPMGMLV